MIAAPLKHDGIEWVEIRRAAQRCGLAVSKLEMLIATGEVRKLEHDEAMWIPHSAVRRLTRENAVVRAANRKRKLPSGDPDRLGPHAARERQDILPMSSGRSGTGWAGQKPRD